MAKIAVRRVVLFLLAGMLLAPGILPAQEQAAYDVFLPPDHMLRRQLEEARAAVSDGKYNTAVELLGGLMFGRRQTRVDDPDYEGGEDYFIEPAQEGSAQRSLKAEARQMLAALPKQGLDAFQLLYGRQAELLLEKSLQTGDVDLLTEVIRKYPYTTAGYEAAMLLGRYHFSQGRPLAAAISLKQLHDLPARRQYEPELSILLAASWLLADEPQRAKGVLIRLRNENAAAPLYIADKQVAMFRDDDDALDWLREVAGDVPLQRGPVEDQWIMYRGNAARNAPTKGGAPLGQVRWAVPVPNDLKQQTIIADQQQQYLKQQVPALPSSQPLVVRHVAAERGKDAAQRDIVLTRTPSRLLAVDFHTGQRIWFYPPWRQDELSNGAGSSFSTPPSKADSPQTLKLKQRTWSDAPYGQLSSDGKQVYFIHELGLADRVGPTRVVAPGGIIRPNPNSPKSFNELVALELAREGFKMWSVGGEHGGQEPKLAGAFFLGPPLPLMDSLYVLAEMKGDIRLVVLDPKTGKLQWQQQLCGVDNQSILDNSVRRLGGASPSFSEGVLICPTSAGAVVAVDVAKRSLLWGYQYLAAPKERRVDGGIFPVTRRSRSHKEPGEAWADSSVTIAGNKVFVTPVEHDEIICLDLLKGTTAQDDDGKDQPLWRRPRGEALFLACVHDHKAVIVGKGALVAVNVETGETVWKANLPDAPKTMPSGRGFQSGDSYFLPLTSSELAKIDLKGGKLLEVAPTRGILGNLICYRDTVISQGTTELASFYQREALGRVVAARLKKNPDDAWALARRAELLLKDGQRAAAIAALRKSYELEPDDGTKTLLVSTLLGALKDDFAANEKLAAEVESLIDRPDQRSAYLWRMAQGLQEIGRHRASFDFYLKIVDEAALDSSAAPGVDSGMQHVGEKLQVRRQRWLRGQLSQLLREAPPEDRAAMDEAIERRLKSVLEKGSIESLRRFVEFFGEHAAADRARFDLASRLWNAGELLKAEIIFVDLARSPSAKTAAAGTAGLARLLSDAGHVEEAAELYRRLRDEYGEVDCGEGKTGRQVLEDLAGESLVAKMLAGAPRWPLGRVTFTEHDNDENDGPKLGYSSYQRVYPTQTERVRGTLPEGARIVLDRQRRVILRDGWGREGASVQLVDSDTGGSRTSRYYTSNYSITHTKVTGHLALVSLGYELLAVDLLKAAPNGGRRVLWREDLTSPIARDDAKTRQHSIPKLQGNPWGGHRYFAADGDGKPIAGFACASQQGVVFRRWEQLICIDPLRPDVVHWTRDGIAAGSRVFGDDDVIFVVAHDAAKAQLYSALDGSELGQCEVGDPRGVWATFGRRILRWDEADQGVTISLIDPWDPQHRALRDDPVVWSRTWMSDAKGARVEDDEIALLQTDGALTVLDCLTGKVHFTTQLEAEPELDTLYVLRGADEYIVLANHPVDDAPAGITVQPVPGGYGPQGQFSPLVKGRVYALDRKSGKLRWPTAAVIEHFGFPLDQPTQLPFVTFMRNVSTDTGSPSRSWKTEIVCLDKRDGRIVFHKDDIPGNTQVYRVEAEPNAMTAAIMLPGKSFTLEWTDQPRPPEPPAQLGSSQR